MNKLLPVGLFLLFLLNGSPTFSQDDLRVPPAFTEDQTENIVLTTINFDEIFISGR